MANLDKVRFANGRTPVASLRLKLQKVMQNNAAVFRTGDVLKEGCEKVADLYQEMADLKVSLDKREDLKDSKRTIL